MLEGKVNIVNQLGLHARAAAQLVHLANGFKSSIKLQRNDNKGVADAKSILSVLTLAATIGTELLIFTEGIDEAPAMAAIRGMIEKGFGEM